MQYQSEDKVAMHMVLVGLELIDILQICSYGNCMSSVVFSFECEGSSVKRSVRCSNLLLPASETNFLFPILKHGYLHLV